MFCWWKVIINGAKKRTYKWRWKRNIEYIETFYFDRDDEIDF